MADAPGWKNEYEAPVGQVYVCAACGKSNKNKVDVGDESCFLNAVLCYADKIDGHWKAVEDDDYQGEARDEPDLGQLGDRAVLRVEP